ncbi:transcription elongation factor S-II protein, partial [Ancylostoma duodenale]
MKAHQVCANHNCASSLPADPNQAVLSSSQTCNIVMTVDDAILSKVNKYGKLIKKKEKVAHVLSRLNNIDMTLEILSATNIGRYVNRRGRELYGERKGREGDFATIRNTVAMHPGSSRSGRKSRARVGSEVVMRSLLPKTMNHEHVTNRRILLERRTRRTNRIPRAMIAADHAVVTTSGHEDGYSNDDSDGHASGKHRRRHGEDEEHSGDESDQHHTKRSRDMEHGREDDDHSSDNAAHSPERTYDSDGYRDVESPKASATSSKQRQSSSHGNTSRKRRHSSEEPEPAQHSSSSKTPAKVIPSKKVVTEFDMILQSADSGQPKHKKRDHHKKWSELPVLSNYQPFPQAVRAAKDAAAPPPDDFNPENMFKPRNERGKVFAGRRKNIAMSVPSLFNICLRVLCNNIG